MKLDQVASLYEQQSGLINGKTHEQIVEEGIGATISKLSSAVSDALFGGIFGAGATIASMAANVSSTYSLAFWPSLKVVMIEAGIIGADFSLASAVSVGSSISLFGFGAPVIVGAGAVIGATWALLEYADGGPRIQKSLQKLESLVEKRDKLIRKFNQSEDERAMNRILNLNTRISELSKEITENIRKDNELEGMVFSDESPLSEEQQDRLEEFMMASDRNSRFMAILSNLDEREFKKFNETLEKRLEQTEVPEEVTEK